MVTMNRLSRGFTLIELLVVIAAVMLLATVGIAGYSKFNDRQTLAAAARGFISLLREAQQDAASDVKPPSINAACPQLQGFTIYIPNSDPTIYSLNYWCGGQTYVWKQQVSLPTGVKFNINGDQWLTFYGQTGGASTATTFVLKFISYSYAVSVDTSGNITDVGFQ